MNYVWECICIIVTTVLSLFGPILGLLFSVFNEIDSIKEYLIAAGLRVPVIVVSVAFGIASVIGILIKIFKKWS